MLAGKARRLPVVVMLMVAGAGGARDAVAQHISINYERLSSLEEPIAREVGDVTFVLTGLVDTSYTHASEDGSTGTTVVGNSELSALTQLSNRWRVGVRYFGQYATDEETGPASRGRYSDNVAMSVGGVWGTFLAGDVSGVVREQTRRVRGAGSASLEFDNALAGLETRAGAYTGRFGPWILGAVVDAGGHFDLGATYQRPVAIRDYRVALRMTRGEYTTADGSLRFDARALAALGEIIFGSTTFDAVVGLERFSSVGPDAERRYVSSGVRTKLGVVTVSVEGHVGRVEGQNERSAAFGLQYDLARGLSANLGLNLARSEVDVGGAQFTDARRESAVLSLRYSF